MSGYPDAEVDRCRSAFEHFADESRSTRERPVKLVFYATAWVSPGDDLVHFTNDIYGHDATLDRALASSRARTHVPE
jgi:murein L,D-transpeptidase YcbB/YkuD